MVEDARGFAALEGEWDDLYRDAPAATPFQSWPWLYSWWESYGGGPRELRLVMVRDGGGRLVGLLPLMLERRRGFGRLLFLGTGVSDYLDVVAREGWEGRVAEAGAGALGGMGPWQVADLQELRPGAAAWGLVGRWPGPKANAWQSNCPIISMKSQEELFAAVSRNLRGTIRKTSRRAEGDGLRRELAGEAEAEGAARRLVALHRERWRGQGIAPEHLTRRFESHLAAAARRMTPAGLGAVSEFRRDGEVLLSLLWIFGRDFVGSYIIGASSEASRRYQVSSLYILDGVDIACGRSSARVDLLRGEEPYKLRWGPEVVPNHRAILGRRVARWAPYAGYYTLRSEAVRYVRSEGSPDWVKDVASRVKGYLPA